MAALLWATETRGICDRPSVLVAARTLRRLTCAFARSGSQGRWPASRTSKRLLQTNPAMPVVIERRNVIDLMKARGGENDWQHHELTPRSVSSRSLVSIRLAYRYGRKPRKTPRKGIIAHDMAPKSPNYLRLWEASSASLEIELAATPVRDVPSAPPPVPPPLLTG